MLHKDMVVSLLTPPRKEDTAPIIRTTKIFTLMLTLVLTELTGQSSIIYNSNLKLFVSY